MNPFRYSLFLSMIFGIVLGVFSCQYLDREFGRAIPDVELEESNTRLYRNREGVLFNDSIPFSGFTFSLYDDGQLKARKSYLDGRLEGVSETYFPSGLVQTIRSYHGGEKHGLHKGFFENGQSEFLYDIENGFNQGTHFTWYSNGDTASIHNYKDGHELGVQKMWRQDGKMKANYVVRENGRRYGLLGVKRCAKIDSETGDIDPYKGNMR
jgi:antitoxin component YwqK of YwqJK toxin-antitoxin module